MSRFVKCDACGASTDVERGPDNGGTHQLEVRFGTAVSRFDVCGSAGKAKPECAAKLLNGLGETWAADYAKQIA